MKSFLFCLTLGLLGFSAAGQNRVDSRQLHERIVAVVPLTGAGTYADPRRPLFAPNGSEMGREGGIIEYRWTPSDDGKLAIVEFVARDRAAFAAILSDPRTLKSFEKGKAKQEDVEKEMQKFRKDFALDDRRKP